MTAQQWQAIAKDPSGHAGQKVIVYGHVIRAGAATGEGYQVRIDGVRHASPGGYPEQASTLRPAGTDISVLLQGSDFQASVVVGGAQGAAPLLVVDKLKLLA